MRALERAERLADYYAIRSQLKTGDVIAFAGRGPFAQLIKFVTRSVVSHSGVIIALPVTKHSERLFVVESNLVDDGLVDVTLSLLSDRIDSYDGELWWLPLSEDVRRRLDEEAFRQFIFDVKTRPYDLPDAIFSGLDAWDSLVPPGLLAHRKEDLAKVFCSELVAAALEIAGVIRNVNASEVTPIDLCMFRLYSGVYAQLKGPTRIIKGYNTIEPDGWGM